MTTPDVPAFDLIAERYDESFTDRSAQLDAGAWLLDGLPAGSRVLDHGCGSGLPTAVQIADAGHAVVGTDESGRMLDLARARVPSGDFRRQDLRDLGDDLGEFAAIASFFALLMLPRDDIGSVLGSLRARLAPGGRFALSMVYGDFDFFPISFLGVATHASAYPTEDLVAVVERAGFAIDDAQELDVRAEPQRVERQVYVRAHRPA